MVPQLRPYAKLVRHSSLGDKTFYLPDIWSTSIESPLTVGQYRVSLGVPQTLR